MTNSRGLESGGAIGVTSTTRPKRVAFLVNPTTNSVEHIDALTQLSCEFWGGGYWPIVPTDGDDITDNWRRLLLAVDPDLVVACCKMSDTLYRKIERYIAPAKLMEDWVPREIGGSLATNSHAFGPHAGVRQRDAPIAANQRLRPLRAPRLSRWLFRRAFGVWNLQR
jgi:hypothetical protein